MPQIISQNIAQMFGSQSHTQNMQPTAPLGKEQTAPELLQALKDQKESNLQHLYQNFFETAQGTKSSIDPRTMSQIFGALSPKEALAFAQTLNQMYGYHQTNLKEASDSPEHREESSLNKAPLYPDSHSLKKQETNASLAAAKNQQIKMAEQSISQLQGQTRNFVANMLGESATSSDILEALGPNACFEDVLMHVMMKIAKQEERNVAEKIRNVERGHAGIPGFLGDRARDLGGVAGGTIGAGLGAYFAGVAGGTTGAAVGQDIGERLVGSYTGYNSQESRQIQFEKLKHMMQKLSELMTCISNISSILHQTKKNTLANMRG